MTLKEIDTQLRTFRAQRSHDPAVDALMTRATELEAHLRIAEEKQAAATQADLDAHRRAESALAQGGKIDTGAFRRLRADREDAEHAVQLVSTALAQIRRDLVTAQAARGDRDVATLTPLFAALVALYDERAAGLVEVHEALSRAHTLACSVLPGTASGLQQGYGGPLTRPVLEAWRRRVEGAGLLPSKTQRVA